MKKYLLALTFLCIGLTAWAQFVPAISIYQPPCTKNATLTASATGGTPPYTFRWTGGATGPVQIFQGGPTYSVTVTDAAGNSNVLTANTRQVLVPEITLSNPNIDCGHSGVTATVGGIGNAAYIWTDIGTQGPNPRGFSGATIPQGTSGTYTVSVTSGTENCTASITIRNIRDEVTVFDTLRLCPGTTFPVNGVNQSSGNFTVLTTLGSGCTKTQKLTLIQRASVISDLPVTICQGGSYTLEGRTFTTAGTTLVLSSRPSAYGCDSTIRLTIMVTSFTRETSRVGRCQGESYSVGTNTYNTSGTYRDTLQGQGSGGCSKIVTTILKIYSKYNITNTVGRCAGQSVVVNGHTYSTSGIYRDTMQALGGCDSLVTTLLTVYPTTNRAESIYRCLGESYTVGGITYTSAVPSTNIYTSHLQSWKGCDSTIVTTLTFDSRFRINKTVRLCGGQTYTVPVPNGPTYTASGTYTFETFSTAGGCDTTRTTIIQIGRIVDTTQTVTICKGQSVTVGTHVYTTSGVYTDVFSSFGYGCDSTMRTTVVVSNPVLQAQVSYTLCSGRNLGNIVVTMTGGVGTYTYNWGSTAVPPIPFRACLDKGQYSVTVTDAAGCTATERINVYDDDYQNCLQIHEGITPDGDVHNETWQIPCIQDIDNVVQIYNRWGQILFEAKNYSGSFNGVIDGKPLSDGTYYYVVDTKARTYRGTLTILRQ